MKYHITILITTIGTLLCNPSLYQTHDDDNDDICHITTMLELYSEIW